MRSILLILLLDVLFAHPSVGEKIPKADRIPAPPTPAQAALIREGVALHDQQKYDEAIARYKEVLAANPWEVNALHELAFTYFAAKRYDDSLATARLGLQCRSQLRPMFYMALGTALDETGKGKEAIAVYKAGIKENPTLGILHYNLAISLNRAGQSAEAKAAAEHALLLTPAHPGSHAVLATLYQSMGYRIPAILAYSRFLVLEPESARASQYLPILSSLLTAGVRKGDKPGDITILMTPTRKDLAGEGDFTSSELMMSIVTAATVMKPDEAKKVPESAFQRLVSLYTAAGESLASAKGGFAATYYAPYFAELVKAGHTEAFVAQAWKAAKVDGAAEWAEAHAGKVDAFLAWSKAYQWPQK